MSRRRDNDLERLSRKYPIIVKHLDRLLPFAGLWTDLSFTALRRLSRIKCPTVGIKTGFIKEYSR